MSDFADRLRIVPEFQPRDHDRVVDLLFGRLERRLQHWEPESVELEISVKDRGSREQKVTLECWLPTVGHLVATSREENLFAAVIDARDEMWRQIDRALNKLQDARTGKR
ncbi:MAG: hypothetical protein WD011_00015 [Nitriliruptoraceae bacterium]